MDQVSPPEVIKAVTINRNALEGERFLPYLIISTATGLGVVFFLTYIGLSILYVVAAFIFTIFIVLSLFMYSAEYTVDSEGIKISYRPKYPWTISKPTDRTFYWKEILSYKIDENLRKNTLDLKKVFTIYIKGYPSIVINSSSEAEKKEFEHFYTSFLQFSQSAATSAKTGEPYNIVRNKTFFEKPIARVISWSFMLLTAIIIASFVILTINGGTGGDRIFTTLFRILIVLVPGSAYMLYRSYRKRSI